MLNKTPGHHPNKKFRSENGKTVALGEQIAAGGQGIVYAVHGQPDRVAKIYTNTPANAAAKLAAMVANPPHTRDRSGHYYVAFPAERLYNGSDKSVAGFLMPRVGGEFRKISNFFNPKMRSKVAGGLTYEYLLTIGSNLAIAVKALHERGYIIGDINSENIMANGRTLVTLIDADSFQVTAASGKTYYCTVGRPEYTAPELSGKKFDVTARRQDHDCFGLAVVIFQLLMHGTHPFDAQYTGRGEPPSREDRMRDGHFPYTDRAYQPQRHLQTIWDGLHPSLRDLFQKSFRHQASSRNITRPSALEWMNALDLAKKRLKECRRNPQHKYFDNSRGCIWCQLDVYGINAFPALPANARQPARTTPSRQPARTTPSRNPVSPSDQLLDCRECGKQFLLTVGEQQSFQSRGLATPRRCSGCRQARRDPGQTSPNSFPIKCSKCGAPDTVTFRPDGQRPVYCRQCLSRKRSQPDPWDSVTERYQVGDIVAGTVTRLMDYGAFVKLNDGIEGLVHISELSARRINHPKEMVHQGQQIKVQILSFDTDRKRMSLSYRKVYGL